MIQQTVVYAKLTMPLDEYRLCEDEAWAALRAYAKTEAENNCLIVPPNPDEVLQAFYADAELRPTDVTQAIMMVLTYQVLATA